MPHTKTQRDGLWYGLRLDALGLERVTWYGGRSWDRADGSASGAPHVTCYELRRLDGTVLAVAERRHGETADAAARRCADAGRASLRAEADERIGAAVLALSEALDPNRQGDGWPDPLAWDGRDVRVQARDLLVLADADADGIDGGSAAVRDAARSVRAALRADFSRSENDEKGGAS